ncbi:MAG: DUF721 domain-containing protein [Treponema sp.]|jgi:hypothetical protein|nr:DUF721 domain-containing protein [Treponema sp.]
MKRVGDLISAIFDERFMEKSRGYSSFFFCWEDLMIKNGIASAAGHSWIKSAEKGLVWIEVDHPGWKQILQTKESKLLHDFRYRFPDMDISGISIVLCKPGSRDTHPQAPAEKDSPTIPKPVPGPAEETRNDDYGAIKDEALKKLLMRLEKQIAERENH